MWAYIMNAMKHEAADGVPDGCVPAGGRAASQERWIYGGIADDAPGPAGMRARVSVRPAPTRVLQ